MGDSQIIWLQWRNLIDCSFVLLRSCVQAGILESGHKRGVWTLVLSQMNGTHESFSLLLKTCPTLNNRQLNNHTASSWLSKNECGFALCVFTENVTINYQLSNHNTIPIGRNIYGGGTEGHAVPLHYFTFVLNQNSEKTVFSDNRVLPHLELFILNGELACCHKSILRDALRNSCLKCIISL